VSDALPADENRLRLGVSSCLLGQGVRFDGGHKRDRFVTDLLGPFVEWVPVCPEFEAGMGVPRPAMRLLRADGGLRMREIRSGRDHTQRMQRFAAQRVRALRRLELCGYILKKDSPSCGPTRVKVYGAKGVPKREGRGLYASALMQAFPGLPAEDEGRLEDSRLRENFIERVFAYRRLRRLFRGRWTKRQVVAFHAVHELQLMAHSPTACRELGRRVAGLQGAPRAVFRECYQQEFMEALAHVASPRRNANVLRHAADHLKGLLDPASRRELTALIDEYRSGLISLLVPVTLMVHHARRHEVAYLNDQSFLEPHPKEQMLRNHV
jgi:uncharacterized protein YbbK (DUF523 family)/uncharacterized protein YbgA (DUF1722 family)